MPTTFNMSDVMISYSRKDKTFVQQLNQALKDSGRNVWIDFDDIAPTVDWWSEIQAGINAAHTFVFVITPNSIRSSVCDQEIDHASRNNKRIVPILREEITDELDKQRMHSALKIHNWINFREQDDFNESFRNLVKALETDLVHVQIHTRLLVLAQEWDTHNRKGSLLLRGDDLRNAETWLTQSINSVPPPTALQADFIAASRRAAIRFRQTVAGAMAAALVILSMLAIFAFSESSRAQAALEVAHAQGTEAAIQGGNADAAKTQQAIADFARQTQIAIAQENQTIAAAAGTLADNNQMTANAAATQGADIQNTANAAATAASNAQATSGTEAANLMLTSDAAATAAADANNEARNAQGTADANAAAANAAATSAAAAQQTASAQAVAATAAKQQFDAQATAAQQSLNTQIAAVAHANATGTKVAENAANIALTAEAAQENALNVSLAAQARTALSAGDRPLAMHLILLSVARSGVVPDLLSVMAKQTLYQVAYSTGLRRIISSGRSPVYEMVYAPNANMTALGRLDGTIEIRNAQTGELLKGSPWTQQTKKITAIAFSPNENYLVSASEDGTIRLRNLATGELVSWNKSGVSGIGVNSDGTRVITSSGLELQWWDTATKTVVSSISTFEATKPIPASTINVMALNKAGTQIVTGLFDSTIATWNLSNDTVSFVKSWTPNDPKDARNTIHSLAFSLDGRYIASGSVDGRLYLWEAATGKLVWGNPAGDLVTSIAFTPDGNSVVSGLHNGTFRLWDVKTGSAIGDRWIGHTDRVAGLDFDKDGKHIISASWDGTARIWDLVSGQTLNTPWTDSPAEISSADFSTDGHYVVSSSALEVITQFRYDISLQAWNATTGTMQGVPWKKTLLGAGSHGTVAFSPTGNYIAAGLTDGTIQVWNTSQLPSLSSTAPVTITNAGWVNDIAFSPDGNYLVSVSGNFGTPNVGAVRLWRAKDGAAVYLPMPLNSVVYSVAFSPKANCTEPTSLPGACVVAIGLRDGTVRLLDLGTSPRPKEIYKWQGHIGIVWSVAFSPDAKFVVSGSADRMLRLWNAQTGIEIGTPWLGHAQGVNSVAFSRPKGEFVISGSSDNTLRLWDVTTGQSVGEAWGGHTGSVNDAALSPDGRSLVSASGDKTLRLWDFRDLGNLVQWVCASGYARFLTDEELLKYGVSRAIDAGLAARCAAVDTRQLIVAAAQQSLGESMSALTSELTPELTPEITPELTPETTAEPIGWIPSGGWTAMDKGWTIVGGAENNLLTSDGAFDLSTMVAPQLSFSSLVNGGTSLATVQISPDGLNWSLLATLQTSAEVKPEAIDLSAYIGQAVWLQFAWFHTPTENAAFDSWSMSDITVADAPILPTPTPSETPTATATPAETATLAESALPSLTPSLTFDVMDLTPTIEVTFTPDDLFLTATLTATITNTPLARALPASAGMDDGAPDWSPSGEWLLTDAARFGESGLGWFASAGTIHNTLTWEQPLDLTQAIAPHLQFESLLQNNNSLAVVNASIDGLNWQPVSEITPSTTWKSIDIDLSGYRGQVVWLQYLWLYGEAAQDQPVDFWMLDEVQVVDVPLTPTPIPDGSPVQDTMTPSLMPPATIVFTETPVPSPTLTDIPIPSETPSPTDESTATASLTSTSAASTDTTTPTETAVVNVNTDTPVPVSTVDETSG